MVPMSWAPSDGAAFISPISLEFTRRGKEIRKLLTSGLGLLASRIEAGTLVVVDKSSDALWAMPALSLLASSVPGGMKTGPGNC